MLQYCIYQAVTVTEMITGPGPTFVFILYFIIFLRGFPDRY